MSIHPGTRLQRSAGHAQKLTHISWVFCANVPAYLSALVPLDPLISPQPLRSPLTAKHIHLLLFIRNAVKLCTVPVAKLLYSRSLISQTAFVQSFLIFFSQIKQMLMLYMYEVHQQVIQKHLGKTRKKSGKYGIFFFSGGFLTNLVPQ